jgi:hypothetical protein
LAVHNLHNTKFSDYKCLGWKLSAYTNNFFYNLKFNN